MKTDADDHDFHIWTDQEIVSRTEEEDNSEGEEEKEENDEQTPSHSDAFNCPSNSN
jgi:hypothetical protein